MAAQTVLAAVITSVFTISGILLKDFFLKRLEENRSDARLKSSIYERYSNPLATSSIEVLNRLSEILFAKHRPVYLKGKWSASNPNAGGEFRAYKKLSTTYRLASMLGWLQACRREFSYLRVTDPRDGTKVANAIDAFENALADGSWVEQERVTRLCELWQLCSHDKVTKIADLEGLGVKADNLIWDHLENAKLDDASLLSDAARRCLCRSIADCISAHLNTNQVSEEYMDKQLPYAFAIVGMRESWIYRDWQKAIGDIMVLPIDSDARRFEVIGYGAFEHLISEGTEEEKTALRRLLSIFEDLDLSIQDRFDSRPRQLRAIAQATAELLLALYETQGRQTIIAEKSVKRAETVIRQCKEADQC